MIEGNEETPKKKTHTQKKTMRNAKKVWNEINIHTVRITMTKYVETDINEKKRYGERI